jgi:hypothetical protein
MNLIDRIFYRFPGYRKWRGLPEPISPTMAAIMRGALSIFNEKAKFVAAIDRQYPLGEISGELRVRVPNKYSRKV